ncbi:hypothetical protein M917_2691 [Psychrobacter aquaticus CMS 56]|uniref:Uncharacterized protein n=1 Tax=Psychrobacter aquaticus CMS 56 TaxID=1354303 RepID=U4T7V4_9GAMM|nr:hypothetical protein M917_2691 [Psychrobacter aquaticus CMS 56]
MFFHGHKILFSDVSNSNDDHFNEQMMTAKTYCTTAIFSMSLLL